MANDYIVRLQGLDNLSGTIKNVKNSLNELGGSADRLDKIQQRFKRIEESSAPLKKKLKDVKLEMEKLAITGDTNSELFKKMALAALKYQLALDLVNQSTRNVRSSSSGMLGVLSNLKGVAGDVAGKAGLGNLPGLLTSLATPAGAATVAIGAVATTCILAAKSAAEFETHLDSLQSLTGLSDEAMKDISKGAIEMSKEFRSSASEIVDAMKLIGSQAPELLSDKDALMEVTKAANVLAEAALIEVVDAAKGITTVMNQMGVSASDATNIINTLAAASLQGSADVAYLNKAFEKAGTAAKGAGMDYVQLSAAIETIAPKFSSADVAGSQLASTLLKLSMSGKSEFMPSVVGMQLALENMASAEMDDVAIKNLVGESNVTMLKSLIEAKDTFAGYTQSLAGTNTAFEQMATNNDNFEGAVTKLKSAWDALLLTLGQSGVLLGVVDGVMDIMGLLNDIIGVISDVISSFELFGDGVTDNCNVSKVLILVLSDIIKGIGTVLQVVVAVAAKAFNAIKDAATSVANGIAEKWNELKGVLTDNAFVLNIANAWTTIYNKAVEIVGKVKKLWNEFLQWLGLESKSVSTPSPMATAPVKNTNTTQTTTTSTSTPTTTPTKTGGISGGSKGTTTTKELPQLGSIADYKAQLADLDKELNNQVVSELRLLEILAKKADLLDKINELSKQYGLTKTPDFNSELVASYTAEIVQLDKELHNSVVSEERVTEIITRKTELQNKINKVTKEYENPHYDTESVAELEETYKRLNEEINSTKVSEERLTEIKAEKDALEVQIKIIKERNELINKTLRNQQRNEVTNIKKDVNQSISDYNVGLISKEELEQSIREANDYYKEHNIKASVELEYKDDGNGFELASIVTNKKPEAKEGSASYVQKQILEKTTLLSMEVVGSDEWKQLSLEIADLTDQQHSIEILVNGESVKSQFELALEAAEAYLEKMDNISSVAGSVGNAFSSLGSAIGGTGGKMLEMAGLSALAVSQIIPLIVALIGAKLGEALASGTASAAALPFPANIAAIASIIATITALFATFAGSFADGGIISGNSFHGDRLVARVNAGEMILNQKQQGNLFRALDSGGATGGVKDVKFQISGSNLVGTMKNYNNKVDRMK